MTLIAVCSATHSPGVSTVCLALAARTGALLVEADPAGGDLAARWGLALDPGMLTLAAASRRGLTADLVERHCQVSGAGYPVLVSPPSAEQARSALFSLGSPFAACSARRHDASNSHVLGAVADCGRWDPSGPCLDLVAEADTTVLVLRPSVEAVAHARSRLASLAPIARRTVVVTIGEQPYAPAEISSALGGVRTIAVADDSNTAGLLAAGRGIDRATRRTPLIRSIEPLLAMLAEPASPVPAHRRLVTA